MPAQRDPATLMAAARLYYVERRSQAEIAEQLGTSRSNVSRMLTEAQRQGIVEIRINDPSGRVHELEDELSTTFGLRAVRVAQLGRRASEQGLEQVGRQAARLLVDNLKDGMTVAVSWGHALQSMAYAVQAEQAYHVTLVQLVGGIAAVHNEISGQELVRELAVRLGADYQVLHAPATVETVASRDALRAEPSIAAALELAARADLAVVGIGTPAHGSSAAILGSLTTTPAERAAFWSAEPAGDVAARYFDATGRPVRGAVDERVLGVSIEQLAQIPNVIGVAHGRAKTPGVLGALRGRLIDSLVCDEGLARSLISQARVENTNEAEEAV